MLTHCLTPQAAADVSCCGSNKESGKPAKQDLEWKQVVACRIPGHFKRKRAEEWKKKAESHRPFAVCEPADSSTNSDEYNDDPQRDGISV
jgi:hypothetical protein